MISVILPTYNEVENIELIVPRITEVFRANDLEGEIVIVDDNSPDGTAERAQALSATYPVRVFKRTTERGLSSAVMHGLDNARGEICVIMDADLSHPVETLPAMVRPILSGEYDATVGSRYIPGGGCAGWPLVRRVISRGAGLLAKGFTKLSDPTSGFMALRKSILRGVKLDPVGWKIVLEIITRTDCTFKEVPIVFSDRIKGESKLDHRAHLEYLMHLWRLYGFKLPNLMQFVRFCLVGFSGLMLDTLILMIGVEYFGLDPRAAAIYAFVAAVSWNYVLNRHWTFNYGLRINPALSYAAFVAVCLFGLAVRVAVMHLLIEYASLNTGRLYILASFIGIVVSTFVNFLGSKHFAFARHLERGVDRRAEVGSADASEL